MHRVPSVVLDTCGARLSLFQRQETLVNPRPRRSPNAIARRIVATAAAAAVVVTVVIVVIVPKEQARQERYCVGEHFL